MLAWLSDTYTITGGDEGTTWAGRAFNLTTGRWETVSGVAMSSSAHGRVLHKRLKAVDIRAFNSAGAVKPGVMIHGFVVGDPIHTGFVIPIVQQVQGKSYLVHWVGDVDMGAGFEWRVLRGGLIATDIVSVGLGYE